MTTLEDSLIDRLRAWKGRKVLVAMSGGVDSSLSAVLLHEAGAEVIGMRMIVHTPGSSSDVREAPSCLASGDTRDAQKIADQFGFPFYTRDHRVDFRKQIIEPFIEDYLHGRTPNPCVLCNNRLKLGLLLDEGLALGATAIATGHYGCIERNERSGRWELCVSAEPEKDQTYYLSALRQDQLARMVMPLGTLLKSETRQLAQQFGLHLHDKRDSVEICFVADNDYRRFLREEGGLDELALAGEIVDRQGKVLGRHNGIHNYTIGQRRGLGIAAPRPLYVIDVEAATRRVVVGYEKEVMAARMIIDRINWVAQAPTEEPFRARVKIRYRNAGQAATVTPDAGDPLRAMVVFDEPVSAITPGQAAVAYDLETGRRVLAGGWIVRRTDGDAA